MINVAIAEDDFRVAQIHEGYLEKEQDMQIVGKAMNATETMDLLKDKRIDLILLDVYMPDQLGTELLHQIRYHHPGVDIIIITAARDKAFLEKSLGYGVFQYLIKPVDLQLFSKTMEQYKKQKQVLNTAAEVNQDILNQVFGKRITDSNETNNLPLGIDALTLEKVKTLIHQTSEGLTSEKVGEKMGASRTTARRYLEYLVGTGDLKAESVYGIVGRPERRYYAMNE
ncbi:MULTISPECIES: response regulator [Virgibacillus]|uniref:response regulator n=1 Tax=Virgibacillus TaxID=84406 RepID=UPI000388997C|nr:MULTISPECIES: response regulator [Virgibacillus]EQB34906.1 hypothetical protein M948_17510 [Virgibacillus sp. CM-4]